MILSKNSSEYETYPQESNILVITQKNMKKHSFWPFIIAMVIVTLYTIIHQFIIGHRVGMVAMNDFMGIWFLLFGVIKLLDLKGFVDSYRKYDIIAKRRHGYAYLFPFLEIVLGIAYLLDANMQYRIAINSWTLILVAITGIGIFHSLRKKEAIDCVCMGTTFPLKMSKINLWENISMWAMAFFMLIRMGNVTMAHTMNTIPSTQIQQTTSTVNCH